jgi:hypothetical protein
MLKHERCSERSVSEGAMMRRLFLLGFVILAGCQNFAGPFTRTDTNTRADDPYYSIPEQESRGRSRFALPDPGGNPSPPTGFANGLTPPTQ